MNFMYLGGMLIGGMSFFGALAMILCEPIAFPVSIIGGLILLLYGLYVELS